MDEKGETGFTQWIDSGQLPTGNETFGYVFHGVAFSRYHKNLKRRSRKKDAKFTPREEKIVQLNTGVETSGMAALRKGYRGQKLTAGDVEAVRLYSMWVDIRCCGGGVLPFHLEMTRATRVHGGRLGFKAGDEAPDFSLMRMEAGLKDPAYTDKNPTDRTNVLTANISREFLLTMQGYDPLPDSKTKVKAKPYVIPKGKEADFVTLSSFRGKKPVLLVLGNPSDAFGWHWRIAPMFEPIRQAYGRKLEMFFINTTIHDTFMLMHGFYTGQRESAVHDLSLPERARGCKMFFMNWPHFTTDYLLDDMAQHLRNAYMDQGGGAYILVIDTDGKIAYSDYHQHTEKGLSFYDEVVYVRMNNLESRLKSFFDNDAKFDKKIETPFPAWRRSPLLKGAVVKSVDTDKGAVTVTSSKADGSKELLIETAPGTRITVECKPAKLTDILPARPVTISYREVKDKDGRVRNVARWIRDPKQMEWALHNSSVIWLSGRVKKVADGRMTVELIVPPAEKMKGLKFWDQAGDKAKAYTAPVQHRLTAVRRWVKPDAPRTRTFVLDDAADLFLHGSQIKPTDLRPGDTVGVRYYSFQDAEAVIYPFQVRATRRKK